MYTGSFFLSWFDTWIRTKYGRKRYGVRQPDLDVLGHNMCDCLCVHVRVSLKNMKRYHTLYHPAIRSCSSTKYFILRLSKVSSEKEFYFAVMFHNSITYGGDLHVQGGIRIHYLLEFIFHTHASHNIDGLHLVFLSPVIRELRLIIFISGVFVAKTYSSSI